MKRFFIISFLLLVLLIIAGVVAGPILFASWITPDSIVRQIESRLNCRASLDGVDVKIFRKPSRILLTGLSLGPRDQHADLKVPLANRAPMPEMISHCERIELEMRLGALASRRIDVERFVINNLKIQMTLKEDGSNSFLDLFEKPGSAGTGQPVTVGLNGAEASPTETISSGKGEPFSADDLPLSMIADVVELDGGSIYATVEKNGNIVIVDGIQFRISDIDVDPRSLTEHNRAAIDLSMLVGVDGPPDEGERYAEFQLDGAGQVRFFDPTTGLLDPSLLAKLTIAEGSYIDANPTLEAAADMLKELERFGVDIGDVDLSGDFKEPSETELEYAKGILRILKDTQFNLGDYSMVLAAESWLDANSNQHDFQGAVVASEETTAEAIVEVDAWLKDKAGSFASESVRNTILAPVMHEGRIRMGFRSSGAIDEPQVDLVTRLGSISNILSIGDAESMEKLKTQGKQLLEGLKGLFRRPEPPPPAETAPPAPAETAPPAPADAPTAPTPPATAPQAPGSPPGDQ